MKKIAILACLLTSLIFTTSAFAATSDGTLGASSRNNVVNLALSKESAMPCFRTGDTVKFNIAGLTKGSNITLISYRIKSLSEAEGIGDTSIQYINQYIVSGKESTDGKVITYPVRDTVDGIYAVEIKENNNTALTMYYKVGNPVFDIIKGTGGTYYYLSENTGTDESLAYIGSVTLEDSDVTLVDAGVKSVGFKFTKDGVTAERYEELTGISGNNIESDGSVAFVYGVTLYGVPQNEVNNIVAEAAEKTVTGALEGVEE